MPHTVNELMQQAATALTDRNIDALDALVSHVGGWMQDAEAMSSQVSMLEAMLEACYELE